MTHSDDGATVPRRFDPACSGNISQLKAAIIQFDELSCNSEASREPESIIGGGPNVAYDSSPTTFSATLSDQTVGYDGDDITFGRSGNNADRSPTSSALCDRFTPPAEMRALNLDPTPHTTLVPHGRLCCKNACARSSSDSEHETRRVL